MAFQAQEHRCISSARAFHAWNNQYNIIHIVTIMSKVFYQVVYNTKLAVNDSYNLLLATCQ